jgi:hypothetical protein
VTTTVYCGHERKEVRRSSAQRNGKIARTT